MEPRAEEPEVSAQALANARKFLGDKALASVCSVPEDWAHVPRGRAFFVKGWGRFDIEAACAACRQGGVPSAARVRAVGYALKLFGPPNSSDEQLLSILEDLHSPLAQHMRRHQEFWAQHFASLGEVQYHFRSMTAAQQHEALRFPPQQVLWEVRTERLERTLAHLVHTRAFPCLDGVPDVESNGAVLEVVKTPRRVLELGLSLHNCCAEHEHAAIYIDKIYHGEIALVALLRDCKPMALGELCFQMRVDTGFDAQFRELLDQRGFSARLHANCSPEDWDQLMCEVDRDVIDFVQGYDARAPSWLELREKCNARPSAENRRVFEQAEPQLRQSLLNAWAVRALQAVQPQLTRWACGPRVAMALGSALVENKTAMWLDLSGRSVSDVGIWQFAKALPANRTLMSLNLAHNSLRDVAAGLLAKAVARNHGLLDLSLAHNKITEAGVLLLARGLGHNRMLQLLDLSNNGLPALVGQLDNRILL